MADIESAVQFTQNIVLVFFYQNALSFLAITAVVIALRGLGGLNWSKDLFRSVRINCTFFLLNRVTMPLAGFAGALGVKANLMVGVPQVDPEWWGEVPLIVRIIIALYVGDFVFYWCHRFLHSGWLWPIHAVHHSDREMNMTTGDRGHPLEAMAFAFFFSLVLFWFGAPAASVALVGIIIHVHDAYLHSRFKFDHGLFDMILGSPRMHQWHHADDPRAHGKNLGNLSSLWDRLFGTYYNPGPVNVPLGVDGVPADRFTSLVAHPFKEWGKQLRDAYLARRSPSHRLKS